MKARPVFINGLRVPVPAQFSRTVQRTFGPYVLIFAATLALFGTTPSAQAQTFTSLYSFKGSHSGAGPAAGLVAGGKGTFFGTTVGGGAGCSGYGGCGTVFKMKGKTVTTLYRFGGYPNDGAEPGFGSLIEDPANNLYGTTAYGGSGGCSQSGSPMGCGTVFVVTGNKETVLHNFAGYPNDGQTPTAGLIRDSAGNLYGVTNYGGNGAGAMGAGILFKIDKSGAYSVLYNFCTVGECTDGAEPHGGLVMDGSGNIYGTTALGGMVLQGGTVFKYDTSGNYSVIYNFCAKSGCPDGSSPFAGLTIDAKGNLYGTAYFGGTFDEGVVFELDTTGKQTVLHSFGGKKDGIYPEGGAMYMDAKGDLYGTTIAGGASGDGVVFEVDASHKEAVLHSFTGKKSDGAVPLGGLVLGGKGQLYGTAGEGGSFGYGIMFGLVP